MNRKLMITAISTLSLAVAACGDNDTDADMGTTTGDLTTEADSMMPDAADLTLDEEQQARFNSMDRDAASSEYDEIRDMQIAGADENDGGADKNDAMMADDKDSSSAMSGGKATARKGEWIDPSATSFSALDYNDDGKLSVAEFAVYALSVSPNKPKPNDSKKPYLTTDQINDAGQRFFKFDADGDSYLDKTEFSTAKSTMNM